MTATAAIDVLRLERDSVEAEYRNAMKLIRGTDLHAARIAIETFYETRLDSYARALDALTRDRELPVPA